MIRFNVVPAEEVRSLAGEQSRHPMPTDATSATASAGRRVLVVFASLGLMAAVLLISWWRHGTTVPREDSRASAASLPVEGRLSTPDDAPYYLAVILGRVPFHRHVSGEEDGREWATGRLERLLRKQGDQTVSLLAEAVRRFPDDPRLRNDLAVALLERAGPAGRPEDLVRALEAALEAAELDPKLAAAAFNRALLTEKQLLRNEARTAWQSYLNRDSRSAWAVMARRHLAALEQPRAVELWPAASLTSAVDPSPKRV
jgi:hypothetical protein